MELIYFVNTFQLFLKSFLNLFYYYIVIGKFGSNSSKLRSTITIDPEDDDLLDGPNGLKMTQINLDLNRLAQNCLPNELKTNSELDSIVSNSSDLRIKVEENYYFNVYKVSNFKIPNFNNNICISIKKAFLAERCEFFKTFLTNPFNEVKESNVSEIELKEMTKEILAELVYFLYSDNLSSNSLDENLLNDLLDIGEFYLLDTLKRKCANEIILNHLNKENLFDLLKKSRLFDLKKLEFACITYLAEHLFEVINLKNYKSYIVTNVCYKLIKKQQYINKTFI
jgi:hypothetical protein